MQVTETLSEGLKREFKVVVPAAELDAKVNARLGELKDRVRINGFRPGKVPVAHLKRVYGRSAMAEVIEATVRDTSNQIVSERGFKLAAEPKVTLPSEAAAVEKLIAGESDLDYTMAVEIVPPIELADFKTIKLTRLTSEVTDAELDEAVARISEQNRPYTKRGEGEKAAKDDRVVISFAGTVDGKPFEGGTGDDSVVLIGSNTFIPGFEDQLIGITPEETRTLKVTFPTQYPKEDLAGKDGRIRRHRKVDRDPRCGAQSTTNSPSRSGLNRSPSCATRSRTGSRVSMSRVSRQKVKRALLDELDTRHKFEPPPSLVEEEFNRVWKSVLTEMENEKKTFADEGTTEEKAKAEYQRHRRAAGAARPGAGRDRREEQNQRDRRRDESRGHGARAPISRPGAAGVGLLPTEPAGARRLARADLRGKGGRFPARTRDGHRKKGRARGALQGRRRKRGLNALPRLAVGVFRK